MIILKIFGQTNALKSKFNRDKIMTNNVEVNETERVLKLGDTVIYYKLAIDERLRGFKANLVETHGDNSISNENHRIIRSLLS